MDADRLAGFDRADIDQFRLDAHDFAEMDAGRRFMGHELAETNVAGETVNRVVAGGDGLHATAMGNRELRRCVSLDEARQMRQLRGEGVFRQ